MKILIGLVLVAGLMSLAGCNNKVEDKQESQDLTYQFIENNCDTGVVRYYSQQDYCSALRDDNRNRYCAGASRYQAFRNSCPGISWN